MGMLTDFFVASEEEASRYESLVYSDDEESESELNALSARSTRASRACN